MGSLIAVDVSPITPIFSCTSRENVDFRSQEMCPLEGVSESIINAWSMDHVTAVRIVDKTDGQVTEIVQVAVKGSIDWPFRSFDHVAQNVDAALFIQRNRFPASILHQEHFSNKCTSLAVIHVNLLGWPPLRCPVENICNQPERPAKSYHSHTLVDGVKNSSCPAF